MLNNLPKHDCQSVMQQVYLCLDGEMPPEQEEKFLADIERCDHCLKKYKIEQSFKLFLTNKIARRSMTQDIKERIYASIRTSIQK